MSLFEDPRAGEKEFQEYIKSALEETLQKNYLENDVIRYRLTDSGYWSLTFQKSGMDQEKIVFRFRFGPKSQWAEFPRRSRDVIPDSIGTHRKFDKASGYTKVWLSSAKEAMDLKAAVAESLDITIESGPMDYSCCSRYQECSDAKRCVNPYKEIASECRYRINLKHGRNFFME